jgi:hypothetical protein
MTREETWIEPEGSARTVNWTRRARVRLIPNPHNPVALPYGGLRIVRCGIPDTFFTIPARWRGVRGFVSIVDDEACFTPNAAPSCRICAPGRHDNDAAG